MRLFQLHPMTSAVEAQPLNLAQDGSNDSKCVRNDFLLQKTQQILSQSSFFKVTCPFIRVISGRLEFSPNLFKNRLNYALK